MRDADAAQVSPSPTHALTVVDQAAAVAALDMMDMAVTMAAALDMVPATQAMPTARPMEPDDPADDAGHKPEATFQNMMGGRTKNICWLPNHT